MKTTTKIYGIALALTCGLAATLKAQHFYVTDRLDDAIGEYGLDGSTVNATLVAGLSQPWGIAISGNDIFVANAGAGTVGEYSLSGATVNASLITGLNIPTALAVSGNDLFVASQGNNSVGEYTLSGATVNASLISGLDLPNGIAILGTNIFVANTIGGTIGEYTTSGATVNASLISGLNQPISLAISGTNLFFCAGAGLPEYTTSGTRVTPTLVNTLEQPISVAVWGNDVFVSDGGEGHFSEFTTSGMTVNLELFRGDFWGIAISSPSAPTLSPLGFSNGQFQMAVIGSSNLTYAVQMTTNLLSGNWISLLVTNPSSGSFSFTDLNATNQQQFYQVEITP